MRRDEDAEEQEAAKGSWLLKRGEIAQRKADKSISGLLERRRASHRLQEKRDQQKIMQRDPNNRRMASDAQRRMVQFFPVAFLVIFCLYMRNAFSHRFTKLIRSLCSVFLNCCPINAKLKSLPAPKVLEGFRNFFPPPLCNQRPFKKFRRFETNCFEPAKKIRKIDELCLFGS